MKKSIVLYAYGSNSWIGGLYYIKNIAFMLADNKDFAEQYNIHIFVEEKNSHVFEGLPGNVNLVVKSKKEEFESKCFLLFFYFKNNVRYLYPTDEKSSLRRIKSIAWIPDFQHNYLQEMFQNEELERRSATYKQIADSNVALILSSQACKNDFEHFYKKDKDNVSVVRFVSFIEPEIKQIDDLFENDVLQKYNLSNIKFVYIGNQFWKHKNHIVVLHAIKEFHNKNRNQDVRFVFTGKMEDYRNPEYIEELKALMEAPEAGQYVMNLGLIERREQIVIMNHAQFLIQPSLFEGWGTVVEDAKVLDKRVLLSDIPVHREQKSQKCILFSPHDEKQLAELIAEELEKERDDSVEKGLSDMRIRAKEYSDEFVKLLEIY